METNVAIPSPRRRQQPSEQAGLSLARRDDGERARPQVTQFRTVFTGGRGYMQEFGADNDATLNTPILSKLIIGRRYRASPT
jgi:hypothetical protein